MGLIKMPSELEVKKTISILIYGEPGIGKTTLGVSAPDSVLFDYDGGVQRINGAHRVPTLQVSSWEQTQEAIEEINKELPQTQTIVIDTVGKMLDYMSAYIIKNDPKMAQRDGSLSLKGYGVRKTMFVNFIKQLAISGRNVVFIAHEREERRGEETYKRPEIGGSSANDLIKELDLVGYMHAIGKKRTITFDPEEHYYAKNTCNLAPDIEVPANIDAQGNPTLANDFLCKIIAANEDAQKRNLEKTGEYEKLIAQFKAEIAALNDAAGVNAYVEVCMQMAAENKHIFNSKMVQRSALQARIDELKLTFNKEKGCYE